MKNFKKLLIVFVCVLTAFITFGCSDDSKNEDTVLDLDDIGEVDEEKLSASLEKLGYKSLQEYRESVHDYLNYDGNEEITFGEVEGYWYPNNDTNSLFYIEIDEIGDVTFWKFNYSEDETVGTTSIKTYMLGTYTFSNGQKFSLKNGDMVFEDFDTTYSRYDY